ncbi:probable DNM1-dynamin-related GTPase [Serendipita indica DSM 11827]|uniref:Probable DNM1-dynamin-related GTPase n=1 Tax=Serendipita indica (strain DSM 11827) TaxID=1109443 RepID=G4TPP7_SERID|nr:probable DNM1-dynamin-related GTPase [Serendipita indica DSM 11827]
MDGDLIKLVNKLQDTFSNLGGELDMPQLAVVGSQSAGKSSVLENIVGRDFLPRGQGIVTRRPLVLQLIHTPLPPADAPQPAFPEYAQFLHTDRRFTDFAEIRKEIEAETFRVAGQNKGISKLPISLRIYSPNVLDLTLVDLPGLTKIPVGDQPTDIEKQIRNLVIDYISKPNCVILAVSAANVDLANSDSLKLARSVDPQGRRTIGVLTKLDLMDAGTNAADILTGRVYPLKLGFIGVVNRSQQDINVERSMSDSLAAEAEFFKTHPAYRNIAHKQGTKYLTKTLNQACDLSHFSHPDSYARLNTLMGQTQQELNSFGDAAMFGEPHQMGSLVLRLMTQFARDFVASIEGTSLEISTKELSGGARIYYIFNEVFGHALDSLDPTYNLSASDVRTAIRNSTGPRPSLFVPEVAFDLLVKPQIKLLEAPSLRCVELVYEELVKICHNCTSQELQRFPRLHSRIIEVVSDLLRERLGPTSEYTHSLIEIQAAYINTNHPAFVSGSAQAAREANTQQQRRIEPGKANVREVMNGATSSDNDDDDDQSKVLNGLTARDTRSVSASLQERSRIASGNLSSASSPPLRTKESHHRSHHRTGSQATSTRPTVPVPVAPTGTANAKETFLNYFFGGQGPATGPSSTIPSGHRAQPTTVTDILGDEPLPEQDMGKVAAMDMKSLGRHIETAPGESAVSLSTREEMETTLIRSLIKSYFGIVRQSIQDLVPKAIMHFLVNHTSQQVQNRLVSSLYKPDMFVELLHEDETIVTERERVKALLDAYKEAFKTLSEVSVKPL